MYTLIREGGYSMFWVLGFGFVALGWAALYAARGKQRPLGFVVAMMAATLFATASGICSDLGTTWKTVAGMGDKVNHADMALEGEGESMAPGVMGFSLLGLSALLLAVGKARVAREEEAAA